MPNDKPETLAAILAEMRAEQRPYGISNDRIHAYADRIEVAAELERIELREDEAKMLLREYAAAPDESLTPSALELKRELLRLASSPGNVAAIREALLGLAKFTCSCCNERHCEDDIEEEDGVRVPNPCGAIIAARNALSAPARNCDRFKTLDEAREAFQDLRGHKILADVELWDSMDEAGALVRWLFAPAEGKEPDNG